MTNTVDKREIEQFSLLSNQWWNKSGPFSALHKMSNARIEFIKISASRILNDLNNKQGFLNGIKCLDVGCGGGILSERLARLGAHVTGIDASENAIKIANEHATKSRLKINYKSMSTGDLLKSNKKFFNNYDIVIASEVIEHVNNRNLFLSDISNLCRSGGIIIFTTINKSFMGIFLAKFLAESILKTLPRDTHDPDKFISPKQLSLEASKHNIILDTFTGFMPTFKIKEISKKQFGDFVLTPNLGVNYGASGIKL